ncbi:MAG: MerR family transcriptional regulator [Deltaproteobacteria bacterium]|jgi:transposase|nr:MerR family transcriptional regulator [Deltaproteobacteria bacterium]
MAQIQALDKIGLSIDQVSQMTGVKKTTLRYWEKEFSDYLKPERSETKRRQYSLEEVEKVAVLRQLIEEEKYKSAGVRLKLGLENTPARPPGPDKAVNDQSPPGSYQANPPDG